MTAVEYGNTFFMEMLQAFMFYEDIVKRYFNSPNLNNLAQTTQKYTTVQFHNALTDSQDFSSL